MCHIPKTPFPTTTNYDYLRQADEDMLQLLQEQLLVATADTLSLSTPILNAFGEVTNILGRDVSNPETLILTDPITTTVPLSTPPHKSHSATPPRLSPPYVYASEANLSPNAVSILLSHPPAELPKVPYPYSYTYPLGDCPPSAAHYIPPMYAAPACLKFRTHNLF